MSDNEKMIPAIVVHGGAGNVDMQRHEVCAAGCKKAAEAGLRVLAAGGVALDAVEAAVRALEDDPEFNAGTGSALTRDGTVECDASIMDGATRRVGAVAAVPGLPRAIALARRLLEEGEHVMLAGEAAWDYARAHGFVRDVAGAMVVERARKQLEAERARRTAAAAGAPAAAGGGTVGACAIDARGHVAAATSTGGTTYKRRGRVGDTPLPGCGTWAEDACGAASATGHGESIVRVGLTRFVIERLRAGADAQAAAAAGIAELATVGPAGTGGLIVVDRAGRLGLAHNTASMSWATGSVGGALRAGARVG